MGVNVPPRFSPVATLLAVWLLVSTTHAEVTTVVEPPLGEAPTGEAATSQDAAHGASPGAEPEPTDLAKPKREEVVIVEASGERWRAARVEDLDRRITELRKERGHYRIGWPITLLSVGATLVLIPTTVFVVRYSEGKDRENDPGRVDFPDRDRHRSLHLGRRTPWTARRSAGGTRAPDRRARAAEEGARASGGRRQPARTSRVALADDQEKLDQVVDLLRSIKASGVAIIGGDGSLFQANALSTRAAEMAGRNEDRARTREGLAGENQEVPRAVSPRRR